MQISQSPTTWPTEIVCRYFTHSPMEYIRRYISSGNFFFRAIFICKTIGNFFLSTNIETEWGITDEHKADRMFPSGMSSVKKLPTNYESHTDGIVPSVKLWNLGGKNGSERKETNDPTMLVHRAWLMSII